MPYVEIIQKIENVKIAPESTAKVVVNSKSGVVVIGDNVRLLPVAITHGGISIRISGSQETASMLESGLETSEIEVKKIKVKAPLLKA